MSIEFEYQGKQYRFHGIYRKPLASEFFLGDHGDVVRGRDDLERAIVELVPELLTFGGVVFEVTGEERVCKKGEWGTSGGYLIYWNLDDPTLSNYTVLRPIGVKA